MEKERTIIATQIRLPANMHDKIKQEAEEMGVSFNAHLIELLWWGLKVRAESFLQPPANED